MTNVSWVKQFIMAVALLVLGSFAFWVEYKHNPDEEAAQAESKKVFAQYNFKDLDIQSIDISDGNVNFEFHCGEKKCTAGNNSSWKMTAPIEAHGEDSNINGFLTAISGLEATEVFDLKDETPEKRTGLIKEYGLAKDTLLTAFVRKITLKTSKGEIVAYLGSPHPISQDIFTAVEMVGPNQTPSGKIDENKVYLIPSHFKSFFGHDSTYWRNKRIVDFSAGEVDSFDINRKKIGPNENSKDETSKEKSFTVSRAGKDWMIHVGANQYPGDYENIETFLNTLTYLNAKTFISNDKNDATAKAALKGTRPVATVVVRRKAGKPTTFDVFEKPSSTPDLKEKGHAKEVEKKLKDEEARIFLTVSDAAPLYELVNADQGKLNKSVKDLRLGKLLSSVDRFAVRKVVIEGTPIGQPITLVSKDGKWSYENDKTAVSTETVSKTLDRISGNRIRDFIYGKIPPGEDKGLKVTLSDEKGGVKAKISFWRVKGILYARDLLSERPDAAKEAFLVDSTVTDGLPWEHGYFNKK